MGVRSVSNVRDITSLHATSPFITVPKGAGKARGNLVGKKYSHSKGKWREVKIWKISNMNRSNYFIPISDCFLLVSPLCPQSKRFFYLSVLPLPLYAQQTTFWLSSLNSCSVENLYCPDLLHCNAHQVWAKRGCSPSGTSCCQWWPAELTCWTLTSCSSALPWRCRKLSLGWHYPTGLWRSLSPPPVQQKTANKWVGGFTQFAL